MRITISPRLLWLTASSMILIDVLFVVFGSKELVDIIGRYVDDEAALQMIHLQFLSRAIDMKLEKKAA